MEQRVEVHVMVFQHDQNQTQVVRVGDLVEEDRVEEDLVEEELVEEDRVEEDRFKNCYFGYIYTLYEHGSKIFNNYRFRITQHLK